MYTYYSYYSKICSKSTPHIALHHTQILRSLLTSVKKLGAGSKEPSQTPSLAGMLYAHCAGTRRLRRYRWYLTCREVAVSVASIPCCRLSELRPFGAARVCQSQVSQVIDKSHSQVVRQITTPSRHSLWTHVNRDESFWEDCISSFISSVEGR